MARVLRTQAPRMKHKMFVFAASLLVGFVPAHAEVLIYKGRGVLHTTVAEGQAPPPPVELFFTIDVSVSKAALLVFYEVGGQKHMFVGTPFPVHLTTGTRSKGGKDRLISSVSGGESLPDYEDSLIWFRGKQEFLTVADNVTRNEPRLLKGGQLGFTEIGGKGSFFDARFTLIYVQEPTVAANDESMTVKEVISDLAAKLEKKGYTPVQ